MIHFNERAFAIAMEALGWVPELHEDARVVLYGETTRMSLYQCQRVIAAYKAAELALKQPVRVVVLDTDRGGTSVEAYFSEASSESQCRLLGSFAAIMNYFARFKAPLPPLEIVDG